MIQIIFIIFTFISFNATVNAASYSSDTNLFENSYTNNLIDMAESQIDNFNNKSFIVFQSSYNYYLVASDKDKVTVNNNRAILTDSSIVRAIRVQDGYNYFYQYSTINESSTTININSIVVSNIDTSHSVKSKRFSDYSYNHNMTNIGIFVLGLMFAIFVTKERSYI